MALMFICLFLHLRKVSQNHYLSLHLFLLECLSSDYAILTVSKPVATVGDIYVNFAALIFFFHGLYDKDVVIRVLRGILHFGTTEF